MFEDALARDLQALREAHRFRRRRVVRVIDATHVEIEGQVCVNFSSNNYLGLTHHPRLIAAAQQVLQYDGLGSGAAGLVSGFTDRHCAAESAIACWKGSEAAVLLPSGYQANHAAVQTLAAVCENAGRPARFLLDKLAHASLIDAVRGTGRPLRVFPHNHFNKLARLLSEAGAATQTQVVVTESIFSMDGDAADLAALAELKRAHPFLLLLDEAHASGVYGPAGAGYAAELGLSSLADLTVVTLSKALGCAGGVICASRNWCDAVVNHGRAFIFSTSIPPAVAAAASEAVAVLRDEPHRQQRVRDLARRVRAELRSAGHEIPPGDAPIIPVIFGSEERALAAADTLRAQGLLIPAIRPPTVPRGTSRLRITLSSAHTDEEVAALLRAAAEVNAKLPRSDGEQRDKMNRAGTEVARRLTEEE